MIPDRTQVIGQLAYCASQSGYQSSQHDKCVFLACTLLYRAFNKNFKNKTD